MVWAAEGSEGTTVLFWFEADVDVAAAYALPPWEDGRLAVLDGMGAGTELFL